VIPTETVPQGIGALLAFNFQGDMQSNVSAMEQAARGVHTIEVTRAVRDSDIGAIAVKSGEFMGIYDGQIVTSAADAEQVLLETVSQAPVDSLEIVTIYYGEDASAEDAEGVAARIRDAHPGLAAEVVEGGQPHYPFVVSLE
jgi:dihydroxyacetone kinase-like predicted kinase